MEGPILNILAISALVLLGAVTGGVIYLTLIEWRDRRLREQEKREMRRSTTKQR
ncbi:MAG: hypothetical protein WBA07_20210 [Rivularia sp. (in: cyanobacteria)]